MPFHTLFSQRWQQVRHTYSCQSITGLIVYFVVRTDILQTTSWNCGCGWRSNLPMTKLHLHVFFPMWLQFCIWITTQTLSLRCREKKLHTYIDVEQSFPTFLAYLLATPCHQLGKIRKKNRGKSEKSNFKIILLSSLWPLKIYLSFPFLGSNPQAEKQ